MAAPNIVNVTSILGETQGKALTDSLVDIVTNSAASGKVYKVNAIYVSNVDGTNNADADVAFYDASEGGGTAFYIAKTIVVPADATLDVLSKSIYLEEGDKIQAKASATSDLEIVVSYEIIDDA